MSDDPISLNERRAIKAEDNKLWTPLDCAKAVVRDIESGEIKPTQMLVTYFENDDGGGKTLHNYRANLSREEELAMNVLAQHVIIHRWRK